MIPLAYTSGSLTKKDGKTTAAANTDYLQFTVYFTSDADKGLPVYVKSLTITNTTGVTLPTKDVLTDTGLPSGIGATYQVDVVRTLLMSVSSELNEDAETKTGAALESIELWDPEALVKPKTGWADSLTGTEGTDWNAHEYYNEVVGTANQLKDSNGNVITTDQTTGSKKLTTTTNSASEALKVGTAPKKILGNDLLLISSDATADSVYMGKYSYIYC